MTKIKRIYIIIILKNREVNMLLIDKIPSNYKSSLTLIQTEEAIKFCKDSFQNELKKALLLKRVSAPLFVLRKTGFNDNLNGVERPVSFDIKETQETAEVVHSLAKWKRYALKKYGIEAPYGLYTDMNAIRRDEITDNFHSLYVDQWDWEKVINKENRTLEYLKQTVNKIYSALKNTAFKLEKKFDLKNELASKVTFITSQELENMYPEKTPAERERLYVKEKGAIFVMQIGGKLKSGKPHDLRAPDYDDWNLNGDLILYYPLLDSALEISSMGIRVDKDSLISQLKSCNLESRLELLFHKELIEGKLPLTIGGGIGQSRLCMYLLKKAHIGEVQCSLWRDEDVNKLNNMGINLL